MENAEKTLKQGPVVVVMRNVQNRDTPLKHPETQHVK